MVNRTAAQLPVNGFFDGPKPTRSRWAQGLRCIEWPDDIACYLVYTPFGIANTQLARIAAFHWAIEDASRPPPRCRPRTRRTSTAKCLPARRSRSVSNSLHAPARRSTRRTSSSRVRKASIRQTLAAAEAFVRNGTWAWVHSGIPPAEQPDSSLNGPPSLGSSAPRWPRVARTTCFPRGRRAARHVECTPSSCLPGFAEPRRCLPPSPYETGRTATHDWW